MPDEDWERLSATDRPLTVLLAVANRSYGGAERHVVDLANVLLQRGHRTAILCPGYPEVERLLDPGIQVLILPQPVNPLRLAVRLRWAVRDLGPDVVHLHSHQALLAGRLTLAARNRRVRPALVSTAHGWVPERLRLRRLYAATYRATTTFDDATIAVSQATAANFGRQARAIHVIANGIAREPALSPYQAGPERGPIRLGFLGRLTEEKGFLTALTAYRLLLVRFPELELHVFGDGPLRAEAEAKAMEHDLGRVTFHGWVPQGDVLRVLSGFTLLLMTSREEGFPYVVLEAMSAGCPIVATAVGGIPEIIEDGHTGFLIPPDDPAAAAETIQRAVGQPHLLAELRRNAWERLADYSIEAMANRVEQVYCGVLRVARLEAEGHESP